MSPMTKWTSNFLCRHHYAPKIPTGRTPSDSPPPPAFEQFSPTREEHEGKPRGVKFGKQLRRDTKWLRVAAHEGRFLTRNLMPLAASKYHKPPNLRFDLLSPRRTKLFPVPTEAPDYSPRFSYVQPRSPVHRFPRARPPEDDTTSPPPYPVHYEAVTPRVAKVLDWRLERDYSSPLAQSLPSYMGVTSTRLALEEVNEKTLRLSGFRNEGSKAGLH